MGLKEPLSNRAKKDLLAVAAFSLTGLIASMILDLSETFFNITRTLEGLELDEMLFFSPLLLAVGLVWFVYRRLVEKKTEVLFRKHAEESLRLTQFAVDRIGDMNFWMDDNARLFYVNQAACDTLGYSKEELLNMTLHDIDPNFPLARWSEAWNHLKQIRESVVESSHLTRDGTTIPVEVRSNYVEFEGKGYNCSVARDITKRREQETAIRESEERYKSLFAESQKAREIYESLIRSSADAIVITDLTRTVSYISPTFMDIFGWHPEEITGKLLPYVPESEKNATDAIYRDVIENGTPHHGFETKRYTQDDRLLDVSISISRHDDDQGKPVGLLAIIRDISENKRLEYQVQKAQRMEAIGTLAGGVAHDFNNLMMGMLGNISLILYDMDEKHPYYPKLKNIEKQIESGTELTNQLLGYARKGKYESQPIDLNTVIQGALALLGRMKKEIRTHFERSDDIYAIEADQGQIEQVLMNLFSNSSDAMPDGGDILIRAENATHEAMRDKDYHPRHGNYVLVQIVDSGFGMDEQTVSRIFDPFFTTKEMGRGTGLGLASVYGIVKGHGGYIDVASHPGKGSTFNIYLPAMETSVGSLFKDTKQVSKMVGTVLLVDDEEIVIDVSVQMLEKIGFNVFPAASGTEAITIFEKNKDDILLVILDLVMPDMGGGEVYDRLKILDPAAKVLLSSGYSLDSKAKEILNRGCNGFIQKPFNMNQLKDKILEIIVKK